MEPLRVLRPDDPVLLTRVRQVAGLLRPTARAISWHPPVWAAILALVYVGAEARSGYIDYRMIR